MGQKIITLEQITETLARARYGQHGPKGGVPRWEDLEDASREVWIGDVMADSLAVYGLVRPPPTASEVMTACEDALISPEAVLRDHHLHGENASGFRSFATNISWDELSPDARREVLVHLWDHSTP